MRWSIRLLLPFFVLAGFGGYASLSLVGLGDQQVVSAAWSPDHHYRASVVVASGTDMCGDQPSYAYVVVERRSYLVKTGEFLPFCRSGGSQGIELQWVDNTTLAVSCSGCAGDYGFDRRNWGRLKFIYDLDRP